MTGRMKLLSFFFLIIFAGLIVRLFYWQVIEGKRLSEEAKAQHTSGESLSAPRGNILASDGTWLAARSEAYLVFASLPDIEGEPKKLAEKLAPFFVEVEEGEDEKKALLLEIDRLEALLTKNQVVWVPLKHKVSLSEKKAIEALSLPGIGFEPEEVREYPEASVAAQLLGFVGKDDDGEDVGYFGLEGYYDLSLAGKPGFLSEEKDARGASILLGDSEEVAAIGGVDLLTHIDKTIQLSLEKELKNGIEKYGAKGGTAIVMDPKTGAVLAMSSFPSYDPKNYADYGDTVFRNPAISDTFEPGSIFKVLVMAAGLDTGEVTPETKCEICAGPLKIDKYIIRTWNNEYQKDASMVDVIVHSDNVGMSFVGQKLGADNLFDYLTKFGIGGLTGIDLQGEVTPKMREKGTWNIVDVATASFGQGIAVTPMQMVSAVAAIANKGVLYAPQVVDKILGDGWEKKIEPVEKGRVISKKAAEDITAMMAEAAKSGESKWTYKGGFKVAGKTGTAQIPIAGHYDDEKTIASFVGFAPYDNPKFVMLVTLKEPQTSPWASETAAPLWFKVANDLFVHFGIQPVN